MSNTLYWAGIGSRKTPPNIQRKMTDLSRHFSGQVNTTYILRSGGAEGADLAFERGCDPSKLQIFLPFSRNVMKPYETAEIPPEAFNLAYKYHPLGKGLSGPALMLMARNALQVLGPDCNTPSSFIICWTPDGAESKTSRVTGGTGQAIRIAYDHGIPVINMANPNWEYRLANFAPYTPDDLEL